MILVTVVIAVIMLTFVAPAVLARLGQQHEPTLGSESPAEPYWWPQFEREFRAYVAQRDQGTQPGRARNGSRKDR